MTPPMPPNPAPHIIDWLTEIGLIGTHGMGAVPIPWSEITEFQRNSAISLEPWVARLIRRMSVAYVSMSNRAEDEACAPPWRAPVTDRERDTEVDRLRLVLG